MLGKHIKNKWNKRRGALLSLLIVAGSVAAAMLLVFQLSGNITVLEPFIGSVVLFDDSTEPLVLDGSVDLGDAVLYPGDSVTIPFELTNNGNADMGIEATLSNGALSWVVDCSASTSGLAYEFDGSTLEFPVPSGNTVTAALTATLDLGAPASTTTAVSVEILRGDLSTYGSSC